MAKKHSVIFRFIEGLTELSYGTLLLLWIVQAIGFAAVYFAVAVFWPDHGPTQLTLDPTLLSMAGDSLYYSIITATTTGYGDITPMGFSKVIASAQSIVALFLWALFVTKLVSHRQDAALREVHRLSYEEVFHNIREGLFIMRKDFDRIIREVEKHGELSEDDWLDLITAYRQGQSLLQEIPDLYAGSAEDSMYTLDKRRETLLHEAVHRTLHRLNELLNTLTQHDVDWVTQELSMQELWELLRIVEEVTPRWENFSPYTEAFEDIMRVKDLIHNEMTQALGESPRQDESQN